MLAALLGFLAPFLPDAIRAGQSWIDHKQEMQSLRLQAELAEKQAAYRAHETAVSAAARDRASARRPMSSFGERMLKAAADSDNVSRWVVNVSVLAGVWLDFVRGHVRPVLAYGMLVMYATNKLRLYETTGLLVNETYVQLGWWTVDDYSLLSLVFAFYLGTRARDHAMRPSPAKR